MGFGRENPLKWLEMGGFARFSGPFRVERPTTCHGMQVERGLHLHFLRQKVPGRREHEAAHAGLPARAKR